MPVDEEVESLHLKFLAAPPSEFKPLDLHFIWYGQAGLDLDFYFDGFDNRLDNQMDW